MTDLSFAVAGARVDAYAASPSILLRVTVTEKTGARVDAIALRAQIQLEVARRRYLPEESALLTELFGEPSRYAETLKSMLWTHATATVPPFEREAEFDLAVPCSYDFEVAAHKYLASLQSGPIPLNVLFSGTVLVDGPGGVTAELVPWSCEARYALPVAVWREAMDAFFPNAAWIRVNRELFDELRRYKIATGLPTWDAALERLCELARAKR
ncbi:MAG TPA: DUF6084 family protein [Candidatus Dormibacteraeota bacterium]|nr:DUF6084 family protein [Candidatus Dormibacteraeota bacterium]